MSIGKASQHSVFKEAVAKITDELAVMLPQKNLAYGNSYVVVPALMKTLFPDGIGVDQMDNALVIVRIFDKLKRIINNNDPFGENPWLDVAGYAIVQLATVPTVEVPLDWSQYDDVDIPL